MRKNKFVIGLLSLSVIACLGCTKKEIKNVNSQGKNIICFGDSITFGYGVKPGEDYPTALAKLVSIPVLNMGIDGDTTNEAVRRVNSDVLDRDPYIVIIEFCGNDFLRKVPIEVTVNNIREMVNQIQGKGAMVTIVDVSAGMFLKEYHSVFAQLAKETNCIFVPGVLGGIITNPSMKSDFMHPNGNGYKIIAQKVYQAIKPYLKNSAQKGAS